MMTPPVMTQFPQPSNAMNDRPIAIPENQVKYQFVYNITPMNLGQLDLFTYPRIQDRRSSEGDRGITYGISASIAGQLVGLILANYSHHQQTAEIISFLVLPQYRREGIGARLLRNLERFLAKIGCIHISVKYRTTAMTQLALESILKNQNWQPPRSSFVLTKTSIDRLKQAPWVYRYSLPEKFTIFPWIELSDRERKRILERQQYPDALTPFSNDPRLESINSLGLRYQREVIGWTITHRIASDTIRYSTMFVERPFQKFGRGFALLTESVRRQIDSGIPYATAAVATENIGMLRCIERYFKPYGDLISESRYCAKQLQKDR
ncbi:GNAT family N-acetyltransferase [Oxynema sp. CENA135]|uniref:GNAT family N-acetyltransferase n=1 Tax=Oxynema sp. CENA135 TaxID=984206 RepID=UPI0019097B4B|nr:GNAT family N-acetyltransferase [Oxynema sp. CENA135]MBK4729457.1 GNAT family N-acetyltransferase [Oxynema sp. CENA135]